MAAALTASSSTASSTTRRRSKSSSSSETPCASIFEKSRMSLMTPSRASVEVRMVSQYSRCSPSSGVSAISSAIPTMLFMGVRISWLIAARNTPFRRVSRSARSRASESSAVRAVDLLLERGAHRDGLFGGVGDQSLQRAGETARQQRQHPAGQEPGADPDGDRRPQPGRPRCRVDRQQDRDRDPGGGEAGQRKVGSERDPARLHGCWPRGVARTRLHHRQSTAARPALNPGGPGSRVSRRGPRRDLQR